MRGTLSRLSWFAIVAGSTAGVAYIILTLVLTTGDYNRYGEIRLPGEGQVELKKGTVVIHYQARANLHANYSIDEPDNLRVRVKRVGRRRPLKLEDGSRISSYNIGSLSGTSVWKLQVPADGRYGVVARGDGGYPGEEIAFGAYVDMGKVLLRGFLMIVTGILVAAGLSLQSSRLRRAPATLPPRA